MDSVTESVAVFVESCKQLVNCLPDGEVLHEAGVISILSHTDVPFLNLTFHDQTISDDEELQRVLTLALEHTSTYPHPWAFALCEEWVNVEWTARIADFGLGPVARLTGMATDHLKPPRRPLPDLEYRRIGNTETTTALARVIGSAFELPGEMVEALRHDSLWQDEIHGYIGYVSGQPVTSAVAMPVQETIFAGFVATMPEAHGQGYGEAVTRHAIAQCQEATEFTRTTLHASEAGLPLYRAMGYEANTPFHLLGKLSP